MEIIAREPKDYISFKKKIRKIKIGDYLMKNGENSYKDEIVILIPSLNPDDRLIKLVDELLAVGFNNIIVVNDG